MSEGSATAGGGSVALVPRLIAGLFFACGLFSAGRIVSISPVVTWGLRGVIALASFWIALYLMRQTAELRARYAFDGRSLTIDYGRFRREMAVGEIARLAYRPFFADTRAFLPAVVMVDDRGNGLRLPTALAGAPDLFRCLIGAEGSERLQRWADELRLATRIRRGRHVRLSLLVCALLMLLLFLWLLTL